MCFPKIREGGRKDDVILERSFGEDDRGWKFSNFFIFLFKTLKLLQIMNIYINRIRNNLRVTKTKMCVARYTNKIWAQNVFSAIKSYYINNNIMKTIKLY